MIHTRAEEQAFQKREDADIQAEAERVARARAGWRRMERTAYRRSSLMRPKTLRQRGSYRPGCGAGAVEFGAGLPSTVVGSMTSMRVPSGS